MVATNPEIGKRLCVDKITFVQHHTIRVELKAGSGLAGNPSAPSCLFLHLLRQCTVQPAETSQYISFHFSLSSYQFLKHGHMACRQSRRHLSSGEKRLAGLTVGRLSPPFYIIIACVCPTLTSHSDPVTLWTFLYHQAGGSSTTRHLRQIPSLRPSLARTSVLHRGPGSENSIPPSTATKVITSG